MSVAEGRYIREMREIYKGKEEQKASTIDKKRIRNEERAMKSETQEEEDKYGEELAEGCREENVDGGREGKIENRNRTEKRVRRKGRNRLWETYNRKTSDEKARD